MCKGPEHAVLVQLSDQVANMTARAWRRGRGIFDRGYGQGGMRLLFSQE
jgi:hypothetical protein